jgi:septum formation protein
MAPAVMIDRMNALIPEIVLASGSPRRQELLRRFGFPFTVDVSGVDEDIEGNAHPDAIVKLLATRKVSAVASRRSTNMVIGADTIVVIDGQVLNKPIDAADARRMLMLLRGQAHEVWTGVAVVDTATWRVETSAVRSLVRMRSCSDRDIDAYVATGEPLDKAGAYAIQGGAGTFVERIEGCYTNVVGLPLCELSALLGRFGVPIDLVAPVCTLPGGTTCPRLTPRDSNGRAT